MIKNSENNLYDFFARLLIGASSLYPGNKLPKKSAILVHSSLSSFGHVPLGAEEVIDALVSCCSTKGLTVVMPAHSDCSPDSSPEGEPSIFSKHSTPCTGMGKISETFRTRRGVYRSAHPYLSFCAKGSLARALTRRHECETALGKGSPLDTLYKIDALVLMLGTGWDTCSSMHLAEYEAARRLESEGGIADRVTCRAAVSTWKGLSWKVWEDLAYRSALFPEIGEAFVLKHPEKILSGQMKERKYRLMRIRDIVDFSIDRYRVLQ